MDDDDARCPVTVTYNGTSTVRCDQPAGHQGVHWSDDAGVVWRWNESQTAVAAY